MRLILIGLSLAISCYAGLIQAKELRWPATPYSHFSDQQPLRDVLENLAASQGISVVVSERVEDNISVSFTEVPAGDIFHRLVKAYNLIWYYDGNALYIYRHDELQTSTVKLATLSVVEFRKTLQELGIFDQRFSWSSVEDKGIIYFSGPQRFVTLVIEMAQRLDVPKRRLSNVVYSWQDDAGVMNFSSNPPRGVNDERVATIKVDRFPTTTASAQVAVTRATVSTAPSQQASIAVSN